jgi:cytochrome c-type biogenesis protein CcmE
MSLRQKTRRTRLPSICTCLLLAFIFRQLQKVGLRSQERFVYQPPEIIDSENENFHHEKPTRQVLNPQKVFHVKTGQERDVIKEEKE